jgi:hypothetical protein
MKSSRIHRRKQLSINLARRPSIKVEDQDQDQGLEATLSQEEDLLAELLVVSVALAVSQEQISTLKTCSKALLVLGGPGRVDPGIPLNKKRFWLEIALKCKQR